jgi:hypothetical protein|tara:strand:- start:92 stop:283 length:192 start_codon:yes stop_codon:yes gene_type:complete
LISKKRLGTKGRDIFSLFHPSGEEKAESRGAVEKLSPFEELSRRRRCTNVCGMRKYIKEYILW